MLEIPPQLENVIIAQAKAQGMTPVALLESVFSQNLQQLIKQEKQPERLMYDIDQMNEWLGNADSIEEAAQQAIDVPHFDTFEELQYWTRVELPKITVKRKAEKHA